MTKKTDIEPMLRGHAPHRRMQSDYMAALLDRVTLETWGDVIDATVAKAKEGDAQARAFLSAYLVGKPLHEAPTPLAVTAQRLSGDDALVAKLAEPVANRLHYGKSGMEASRDYCREQVAAELPSHVRDGA